MYPVEGNTTELPDSRTADIIPGSLPKELSLSPVCEKAGFTIE